MRAARDALPQRGVHLDALAIAEAVGPIATASVIARMAAMVPA
jgi:hypothetical protein